jgi:peptidoglycan/LPS O-acetylase OafA/YrhL
VQGLIRDLTGFSFFFGFKGAQIFAIPGAVYGHSSADPVIWTISYELWGSLLVFALCRLRRIPYCALALAVALFGDPNLLLFLIGHFASRIAARPARVATAWASIALIALSAPLYNMSPFISANLLFLGVVLCAPLHGALCLPALQYLGRLSFSIYLLHFPLILSVGILIYWGAWHFTTAGAFPIAIICGSPVTVVVAHLFMRWVDEPATALGRKIKKRPATASSIEATIAGRAEAVPRLSS